jgi:diguanylate cyclase (GGDEF)-like protein
MEYKDNSRITALMEIFKTIVFPVVSGIAFFVWLYHLLDPEFPRPLVFPISSLIVAALYFASGPVHAGVLLAFITVVGFLGIFFSELLSFRLIFLLETVCLWGIFFIFEYYRNSYRDLQNFHHEKEDILDTRITMVSSKIVENEHRCDGLTQRINNYQSLGRMIELLGSSLNEEQIIPLIVELAGKLIGKGTWRVKKGIRNDMFAQYVKTHQLPLIVEDIAADNRFFIRRLQFCSLVAVPLEMNGRFWGILKGMSARPGSFDESDLRLLSVLGGIASLVLNNARLYQKTQELAVTDGLTGLYVQSYFKERLSEELLRARSHGLPLSLALLDIDFFKKVNDTYGHATGDIVLRQVASLLRRRLRETDIVCRYGGEEFGILMPQTDKDESAVVVEELRAGIEEERFYLPVESFHPVQVRISVSIGLTGLHPGIYSVDSFLEVADAALYAAKNNGRNRIAYL